MSEQAKSGEINRRTILIGALGGVPLIALGVTAANAGKIAQSAVRYQQSPKEGKQCSGCNQFVAPTSCQQVDGTISPSGWCTLWIKKAG
jgi:hypothetical protein